MPRPSDTEGRARAVKSRGIRELRLAMSIKGNQHLQESIRQNRYDLFYWLCNIRFTGQIPGRMKPLVTRVARTRQRVSIHGTHHPPFRRAA